MADLSNTENLRLEALRLAVSRDPQSKSDAATIVEEAETFEAFLTSSQED